MKKLRTLITSVLLLVTASVYLHAEDQTILTVDVPFAFTVDNLNLPSGTYRVSVLLPYNTLKLQNVDGGHSAFVSSAPSSMASGADAGRLVFQHVGDHYFLTQVWELGNDLRRDVPSGTLARELEKAGESAAPATILASGNSR